MASVPPEEEWERAGLTLLASDSDRTLILFSSSDEMDAFRGRLGAYAGGPPPEQKGAPYAAFIGAIESIDAIEPRDRIGIRLREEGFADAEDFLDANTYLLDVELWDVGRRELRSERLQQIEQYVQSTGGEVLDHYLGPAITMLRVRCGGAAVRALLTVQDIAAIDAPPEPDLETAAALDLALGDLPPLTTVDFAPVIGIIDSGVNAHPLLDDIIVGAIGVPATLGTADDCGHGTRVSGVAVFGDLRTQLRHGTLTRLTRIASAKVVNAAGKFDERRLVPSQMREAVTRLRGEFGVRIFVVALGDTKRTYDGGKVGPWAATLDELARELDVVIIASAGNRSPRSGNRLEQAVTEYPGYLLEPANRFCEPAGAINVLTVGALAHGEGLDEQLGQDVRVRAITRTSEPAPFSRVGPGVGGATKPDLVDVGGTMVYDPVVGRLRGGEELPSAGVLTLNHLFLDQLFTCGSGTSYAAPAIAHKASQLLARMPEASANLVRALLAVAARVPDEAAAKLQGLGEHAATHICGYGRPDIDRAVYSDDHRVMLYAEDSLALDHFAVYEIPIPDVFQRGGKRTLHVSLAYDPPVRHTRADYAGVGMSFRVVRGCDPTLIFEHFRKRQKDDGPFPEIEPRFNCALDPGPRQREKGTLQVATVSFSRDTDAYGDKYYLVVRCEAGWAVAEGSQRFAVAVELEHQPETKLYARLRARVRV